MGDSGTYYQQVPIVALTPDPTLRTTAQSEHRYAYRDDYRPLVDAERHRSCRSPRKRYSSGTASWRRSTSGTTTPGSMRGTRSSSAWSTTRDSRDSTIFEGKVLTYYGRWTYKIEEAARHGAAGILMIHTAESATYPWSTVTSSWTGEQVRLEQPPTTLLAAGWIRDSAAAVLFHDGGQDLDRLTEPGLDPEVQAGAARRSPST